MYKANQLSFFTVFIVILQSLERVSKRELTTQKLSCSRGYGPSVRVRHRQRRDVCLSALALAVFAAYLFAVLINMTDTYTLDKLDVDNYATWSSRIRWLLVSKGLWDAVEQGLEPVRTADQKALACIGLAVKDHHLPTLATCSNARAAWTALETTYKAKSIAQRLQLKRQLNTLKKGPGEPVVLYVARAKALRDQMAAAGRVVQDEEISTSVLAGLPSDYDILATVLETSDMKLDLDMLLGKLLTVEQQTSATAPLDDVAYSSRTAPQRHQPTPPRYHPRPEQPTNPQHLATPTAAQRNVTFCGRRGHLQRDCLRLSRQLPVNGRHLDITTDNQSPSRRQQTTSTPAFGCWTRALPSISPGTSTSSARYKDVFITFGNGERAKAEGSGNVRLCNVCGGDSGDILLTDVLYVPSAAANLLSIPRAVSRGITITFASGACTITKGSQLLAQMDCATLPATDRRCQFRPCLPRTRSFGTDALAIWATAVWHGCAERKWFTA